MTSNTFPHHSPYRRIALKATLFSLLLGICAALYLLYGNYQTHAAAPATTFVVTNVNDSGPGSLRQAILDANANPGSDVINFNITGPSLRIQPLLRLPDITDPVVIDGATQPGFSGAPIVELNGGKSAERGLFVNAPGSTIRGLVINGFSTGAIIISTAAAGSHVEGCYIGTDVSGTVAIPNTGPGVSVLSSNNVIGGTTVSARNVISGNSEAGVQVRLFCCTGANNAISGNVIQGNYIGITAQGDKTLGNGREGVDVSTSAPDASVTNTLIGGTTPGAGNIISGNFTEGIGIGSFQTTNTTVQGNRIGTSANGMSKIPNGGDGIHIDLGNSNVIGGSAPGAGNLISGNGKVSSGLGRGNGISVGSSNNIIQGNFIGTDATGTGPLGNMDDGIFGGRNTTVGGTGAGEGNVIAFNGLRGISNGGNLATANSYRGNSIHSNGTSGSPFTPGLGIELSPAGPNPNDPGDSDTGANNLQNFPIISSVMATGGSTNVKGSLNSSASSSFNLDFYRNSVCDPSGHGEGEHLIGSTLVTTDASGNANFDVTFAVSAAASELLTATATDLSGNTSEFSPCATVGSIGVSIGDVSAVEGNSGTTSFSFPVTLQSATTQDVTITFTTQVGTAVPSVDFVALSGNVTIPAGQTSGQIVVQVNGDTEVEDDEQFFINLTAATNATILDAQGKGTILNDDEIRLLLEESGPAAGQVAALDSVLFARDPFRVVNPANMLMPPFSPNTGVMVFVENLELAFFEGPSAVGVILVDSNNITFNMIAAQVTPVSIPGLNVKQVNLILPTGIAPGTCVLKLVLHGHVSNSATFRIAP
ncbi:MAG TPA: Calx-beta domain-containing protein [Pyrinomonadaceae bacterium]|nr:Calx-beta domain-containing protein [Pyrinomonadaceae bacterium]